MPHRFVIARGLEALEQGLYEDPVPRPVAAVIDISEERLPRDGARISEPPIGERAELALRREREELVQEAGIAGLEALVKEDR
jgi:hypothetical protein